MRENFVLCSLLLALWACGEEPDCNLGIAKSDVGIKFYSSEDSTELFMKFISVRESSTDSIFYNSNDSLSSFSLNLNPTADQVSYTFITSTSSDTLTLGYTKQLEWLSEECGPSFLYRDLEVLSTTFTIDFASSIIDRSIDENIKIYN